MLELAETVRTYQVHWYNMKQQPSWFFILRPKISSQRSWWLSSGQHRKAAEHPFPHDLLLPDFNVETLVIYKARACVCHLLNKVNAHAKSDWVVFCDLHILAKSTSGDLQKLDLFNLKVVKRGQPWNNLEYTSKSYDHQTIHSIHT